MSKDTTFVGAHKIEEVLYNNIANITQSDMSTFFVAALDAVGWKLQFQRSSRSLLDTPDRAFQPTIIAKKEQREMHIYCHQHNYTITKGRVREAYRISGSDVDIVIFSSGKCTKKAYTLAQSYQVEIWDEAIMRARLIQLADISYDTTSYYEEVIDAFKQRLINENIFVQVGSYDVAIYGNKNPYVVNVIATIVFVYIFTLVLGLFVSGILNHIMDPITPYGSSSDTMIEFYLENTLAVFLETPFWFHIGVILLNIYLLLLPRKIEKKNRLYRSEKLQEQALVFLRAIKAERIAQSAVIVDIVNFIQDEGNYLDCFMITESGIQTHPIVNGAPAQEENGLTYIYEVEVARFAKQQKVLDFEKDLRMSNLMAEQIEAMVEVLKNNTEICERYRVQPIDIVDYGNYRRNTFYDTHPHKVFIKKDIQCIEVESFYKKKQEEPIHNW